MKTVVWSLFGGLTATVATAPIGYWPKLFGVTLLYAIGGCIMDFWRKE